MKEKLKENILYALKRTKNRATKITFMFYGNNFKHREHITFYNVFGGVNYKNVSFDLKTVDIDTVINIILDNFHYDGFYCDEIKVKIEEPVTYEDGYPIFINAVRTDKFTFIYRSR